MCRVSQLRLELDVILLHETGAAINCQGDRIIPAGLHVKGANPMSGAIAAHVRHPGFAEPATAKGRLQPQNNVKDRHCL